LASEYGNTPTSPITVDGRRLLTQATSKVLTPEQQQALTPQGIWVVLSPYVTQFLQSPFGRPFRQEFRPRIAAVVLGQPYGDAGIILDAVEALSLFSVHSLKDDIYGNVQKDVPDIIRMLTKSIVGLEAMRKSFGVHWTDVAGNKESPEVDTILEGLRGGLQSIVAAFGEYFDDMKMNRADVRAAREAAKTPAPQRAAEMQETRKRK
jgi:nucleoporin NDC1